jgi:hypothetical protein
MATLPALAVLGSVPVARLSERGFNFHIERDEAVAVGGKAFAVAIVGLIALWGMVPAFGHFSQIDGDYRTPGGGHGAPGNLLVRNATTDQLILSPEQFAGGPVLLSGAEVVSFSFGSMRVRTVGSAVAGSVLVRFEAWPPGAVPQLRPGDVVDVRGMFLETPDGGRFVGVKYMTSDYVERLSQTP